MTAAPATFAVGRVRDARPYSTDNDPFIWLIGLCGVFVSIMVAAMRTKYSGANALAYIAGLSIAYFLGVLFFGLIGSSLSVFIFKLVNAKSETAKRTFARTGFTFGVVIAVVSSAVGMQHQ